MEVLNTYIEKFNKLRVDRSKGLPAPHKPILLLSIIEGIEKQEINQNRIFITPELVAQFKSYWHQLVKEERFTPNFSLPFYHLKSDGFWILKTQMGKELILTSSHSIKSFSHLKEVVNYAVFNDDLYRLLLDDYTRKVLQQTLLTTYFPNRVFYPDSNELVQLITDQIMKEPAIKYRARIDNMDEEEVFVRSGVFKKTIPKIYNHTCAISGMRVIATREIQMIDACHIVPFSESHDDTITNGISLCPNLHRAFDRGLISINNEYRVIVNKHFEEEQNSAYKIKQYEGSQLILPNNKAYYPSLDNFAIHRNRFVFDV